jgi:hypothetical protein
MKMFVQALLAVLVSCAALGQTQASKSGAKKQTSPASAHAEQTGAASGEPKPAQVKPTAAQVMKLLELMHVQDGLQITLDAMKDQLKGGADQALREKIVNPSPEQIRAAHNIVDEEFQRLSLDSMIQDIVPVYQRHFTRSDVDALIAFYSSPAGRKIVREQPAMLRESMQATAAAQRQKMELLLARMDLRIQQLIGDEQNKADPEKK